MPCLILAHVQSFFYFFATVNCLSSGDFICRYTYGKPVVGSVTAKVCRIAVQYYWLFDSSNICEVYLIKVSVFIVTPNSLKNTVDKMLVSVA